MTNQDLWSGERQVASRLSNIEVKSVERYQFAQKYCTDKDVLDAACGCGYGSSILSEVAKSVLGVDNSQEAVDYSQNIWAARNTTFKQADLNSDIATLGNFDVIVSLETVEHLDAPIIQTCQKFRDMLRPNGLLILSHPEKEVITEAVTEEPTLDNPSPTNIIARLLYLLYNRKFSTIWRFITGRLSRNKSKVMSFLARFFLEKRVFWGFVRLVPLDDYWGYRTAKTRCEAHKHYNVGGELVKNSLVDIGFQIKDEWYQPGRFDSPYHLIVCEKNE